MRKWVAFLALAAAAVAAVPGTSQAFGRRHCRPAPCYCPPVVVTYWVPAGAPCYGAPPFAVRPPGYAPAQPQPARTVTINQKVYQLFSLADPGVEDREELEGPPPALAATHRISKDDVFNGKARRIAKVNIFNGEPEPFDSVKSLFDGDLLKDNQHMKGLHIAKGPDVNRVAEEKHNVRVRAFIYAFRKEDDNDYHVILGDAPGTPNPKYLNVEVSGIPVGGSDENRDRLREVRKTFKDAFELGPQGPDSYFRPHPPVPVEVTGSLFWDSEHEPPNTVGPNDFKPKTAWEIHPISKIVFRD